jgi:hypothetical protein
LLFHGSSGFIQRASLYRYAYAASLVLRVSVRGLFFYKLFFHARIVQNVGTQHILFDKNIPRIL